MTEEGTFRPDGIGATFAGLKDAIRAKAPSGSVRVTDDLANLTASKTSLYFIHDLVLFTGPITDTELIQLLRFMFEGKRSYDMLRRLLGVLRSAGLIRGMDMPDGTRTYRALTSRPYLRYSANVDALTASFRVSHMKNQPERFAFA